MQFRTSTTSLLTSLRSPIIIDHVQFSSRTLSQGNSSEKSGNFTIQEADHVNPKFCRHRPVGAETKRNKWITPHRELRSKTMSILDDTVLRWFSAYYLQLFSLWIDVPRRRLLGHSRPPCLTSLYDRQQGIIQPPCEKFPPFLEAFPSSLSTSAVKET